MVGVSGVSRKSDLASFAAQLAEKNAPNSLAMNGRLTPSLLGNCEILVRPNPRV